MEKTPPVEVEVYMDFPKLSQEQIDFIDRVLEAYLKVKENGIPRN